MAGFIELNLKIPSILAISIFMSIFNFMLSRVEHEKCLILWRKIALAKALIKKK